MKLRYSFFIVVVGLLLSFNHTMGQGIEVRKGGGSGSWLGAEGTGGIAVSTNGNGGLVIDGSAIAAGSTPAYAITNAQTGTFTNLATLRQVGAIHLGSGLSSNSFLYLNGSSNIAGGTISESLDLTGGKLISKLPPGRRGVVFYDNFEGPGVDITGFVARRSVSGHSYVVSGSGTNFLQMTNGYVHNVSPTNVPFYFGVSNNIPGTPNWNRFGGRFQWMTNAAILSGNYMVPTLLNADNAVIGGGSLSFFHNYVLGDGSVTVQSNLTTTLMSSALDNSAGPLGHSNIVEWEVNIFPTYTSLRIGSAVTNIYSAARFDFATNAVNLWELFGSTTNSYVVRWLDIWAGNSDLVTESIYDNRQSYAAEWFGIPTNNASFFGGGITLDASGFNGNLATTDNTFQEVAQKLDDLSVGNGSTNTVTHASGSYYVSNSITLPTLSKLKYSNSFEFFFDGTALMGSNTFDGLNWLSVDRTSSDVTFAGSLDVQNIVAATLNTGQGANELYDMDQNVLTTSAPTFTGLTLTNPKQTNRVAFFNASGNLTNVTSADAANEYVKADGSTGTPAGTGDVFGPASVTDKQVAIFGGTSGDRLTNSPVTIDPVSGATAGIGSLTATGQVLASSMVLSNVAGSTPAGYVDIKATNGNAGTRLTVGDMHLTTNTVEMNYGVPAEGHMLGFVHSVSGQIAVTTNIGTTGSSTLVRSLSPTITTPVISGGSLIGTTAINESITTNNNAYVNQTLAGVGGANTNFTGLWSHGKVYINGGLTNVNFVAFMPGTAGLTYYLSYTLTNLTSTSRNISLSSVTNRIQNMQQYYGIAPPYVLTNNHTGELLVELNSTNAKISFLQYTNGF